MSYFSQSSRADSFFEVVIANSDPVNTVRAQTVYQMYTVETGVPSFQFNYAIGIPFNGLVYPVKFRNNTLAHTLELRITKPDYVTIVPVPIDGKYLIAPSTAQTFIVALNEAFIQSKVATNLFNASGTVSINVLPLNVAGPVLVPTNLPPLV